MKALTFLCTMLCSLGLFAQQPFAPIGAEWFYRVIRQGNPLTGQYNPNDPVYETFTVTKDTLVGDRTCRLIEHEWTRYNLSQNPLSREVVYVEGDSVFIYRNEAFHLLFDFSAQPGDTIRVLDEPFLGFFHNNSAVFDEFAYRIDSVGMLVQGGDSLRIQYVSDLVDNDSAGNTLDRNYWGMRDFVEFNNGTPGRIVEGIGSLNVRSFFGTPLTAVYIPESPPDQLGCYQDSARSYQFLDYDCETYRWAATSTTPATPVALRVHPNPFTAALTITIASPGAYQLRLFDALGRQQLVHPLPGGGQPQQLATAQLPAGLYWLEVRRASGDLVAREKLVKQ
jgi:hypothetical protein